MTQYNHASANTDNISSAASEEIDLTEIIRNLWIRRKFILKLTGIFLLAGILIALISPVKYTAHCTVVPQSGESTGGNLGGIAAMMGVNIGTGGSGETLSPVVYPQIAASVPFAREIMQTPVRVEKSQGKEITLYEYYAEEKYQPFNLMASIGKYTIGLPFLLLEALRGNDTQEEDTLLPDSLSLLTLSKDEEMIYQTIQNSMRLNLNSNDGYISIEYTFPEAEAAARITDKVRKTLEKHVIAFKSEKMEDNLAFVRISFEEAREDFLQKQERLATFQDANRKLNTASAQATEQRLRSEYDIAFTVYSELAKQLEQAKLAVKESKPVLTVIEPVVVPVEKSAPRRSIILIGFVFLGVAISMGWIFLQPYFREIVQNVKQQQKV